MFSPIRTRRLVIRSFGPDDVDDLWRRRNDPEAARYQAWEMPFTRERAEEMAADLVGMDGPAVDAWWMGVVTLAGTGETIGEVVCNLTWAGHTAEIGYTFHSAHWGRGYAVEAVEALVAYLYEDPGVTRVWGALHPDNPASAMVLERAGLLFEGHTRSSFWLMGEVSDDWIYGMTRQDWETWVDRPRRPPDEVRLVDITAANARSVASLTTHKSQERFVAPMAGSFRDALFPDIVDGAPLVPWMRAVEADGELVGFVMLALRTEHHPEPYLWRLLIDRLHQRRGIGGRVLDLVEAECRTRGDRTLLTSWDEGKGSPGPFYLARGYVPTGRIVHGETEGRKQLG